MVRSRTSVLHTFLLKERSQLSRDITGTIVRKQPGAMLDQHLVQSRGGERHEQSVLDIRGSHGGSQFPSQDVAREVIQYGGEIIPAPTLDLEVGEVCLPQFVYLFGGM